MSKAYVIPETEKAEMVEAYKSGMSLREIGKALERSPTSVANVLDREGVRTIPRRGPNKQNNNTTRKVTCPNCRATGHHKGAKFCYKCGHDIRTQSDILRERLGKLVSDFQFLPASVRDNACIVIQDTIDYLRKV